MCWACDRYFLLCQRALQRWYSIRTYPASGASSNLFAGLSHGPWASWRCLQAPDSCSSSSQVPNSPPCSNWFSLNGDLPGTLRSNRAAFPPSEKTDKGRHPTGHLIRNRNWSFHCCCCVKPYYCWLAHSGQAHQPWTSSPLLRHPWGSPIGLGDSFGYLALIWRYWKWHPTARGCWRRVVRTSELFGLDRIGRRPPGCPSWWTYRRS